MSPTPGNAWNCGGAGSLSDDRHGLAQRLQGKRHRQLRADRVAVRTRVRRNHEALPLKDRVADLARGRYPSFSDSGRRL